MFKRKIRFEVCAVHPDRIVREPRNGIRKQNPGERKGGLRLQEARVCKERILTEGIERRQCIAQLFFGEGIFPGECEN